MAIPHKDPSFGREVRQGGVSAGLAPLTGRAGARRVLRLLLWLSEQHGVHGVRARGTQRSEPSLGLSGAAWAAPKPFHARL